MAKDSEKKNSLSASFKVGAVALAFIIIGYQTALFVRQAAVTHIADRRDHPDTVYIVERITELPVPEAAMTRSSGQVGSAVSCTTVTVRTVKEHSPEVKAVRQATGKREYSNFPFDPNSASLEDLMRLGFSEKQAASICSYREKGGRFHRKSDFRKSFVVADSVYCRLEPYIEIPLLDINAADSAAFDGLPGIGPYYAAKMVQYRSELGGAYSYAEQLMDIWKFDEEKFRGLQDLICVGPSEPYHLWTLPEDSLRLHPYIRSYAAHGIVLFRENSPRAEWTVQSLKDAGILKSDLADKLSRCNIAEP